MAGLVERLRAALPGPVAMKPIAPSMHTLYWGAHRFEARSLEQLAAEARESFSDHAPDPETLGAIFGLERDLAERVFSRVATKMTSRPIEDVRIDFEDGYGLRPDEEEDQAASECARAAATFPDDIGVGIRIKSLTPEVAQRGVATLDRFVRSLVEARGGLPPRFVICVPKVTVSEQVTIAGELLGELEQALSLPADAIGLEVMVEVPQGIFDRSGRLALPTLLEAGGRRLVGVHLGVYDFTTSYGVAPAFQAMDHPACDFARALVRLVFSGSGRVLSAGSTNVLPVAPFEASPDEARRAVHRAWRSSHDQIRHTLIRGYYHGWDLHPAQVPARWVACHGFFLEGFAPAAERLRSYLAQGSAATDDSAVLDDAATGQALLDFFVRARASGAIDDDDLAATGLSPDELALGSFPAILRGRLS
jgi:citrate lyase beta subunit